MAIDTNKIKKIYGYLSVETSPLQKADGAFVFGRADPRVAQKAADVYRQNFVDYVMVTGGIGKDSGFLTQWNIPEAHYQGIHLVENGVPSEKIYLETKATNAGECCRNGLDTIVANNLKHNSLIIVVHPTSLRRVNAVLENTEKERNLSIKHQLAATNYPFNPRNPVDQKEAADELARLADWPGKGWCAAQPDLPLDLVQYAREVQQIFKK
ncbi:YdcF family protein [Candidatus Pacearchaeota archaeon]|nr:YdcF family protein [Candidatus Pacearchaeota archaeon]